MKELGAPASAGAGLSAFFLKAAPVRAAGLISAIVAFVLMSVFLTLQCFQLSGAQQADEAIGASDYSLQTGTYIPLGASGQKTDDALRSAMLNAGATRPVIQYSNFDGIRVEDNRGISVSLEEGDWASNQFPNRLLLHTGRWPLNVSEVTLSSAVAKNYPVGSTLKLFDANWTVTVVGIVTDDFSRHGSTLFALTGAWNALSTIEMATANRYGSQAVRTVSWSGGDPTAVITAMSEVLTPTNATVTTDALHQQLQSKSELTSHGSAPLIEFVLGSFIAPFVASMIGILLATRFINRIRTVMFSIGIARSKTRSNALHAVALSLTIGVTLGIGAGIAVGFAIRPIMNLLSDRVIGPVHNIEAMVVSLVVASALGGGLGVLLNSLQQAAPARVAIRANRAPTQYVVLPLLSIGLLALGYLLAQAALGVDQMILAGISFALAGVSLLPLALEILMLREPRHMPALLATRRLKADIRPTGWITATVAVLLVIAFATSTLLTSAITTMNVRNLSVVPAGQIHFAPPADFPAAAADALADDITKYLGMTPLTFYVADGGVDILDGSTLVVENLAEFETLTQVKLDTAERKLLTDGGTLRTKQPNLATVKFESADGTPHVFSALVVERLGRRFSSSDGFILRSTAEANKISLVSKTWAFLNPSGAELTRAHDAALALGFNSDWLAVNKAPDVFSEPVESRIAAITISLLAVTIMIFFVLSTTRLLRVNLSTLRAIGASSQWLTRVLLIQIGTVLLVAVFGAAITAIVGMFATIRISGVDLSLTVPWQSLAYTVVTLIIGTTIAALIASRRLTNNERFTST